MFLSDEARVAKADSLKKNTHETHIGGPLSSRKKKRKVKAKQIASLKQSRDYPTPRIGGRKKKRKKGVFKMETTDTINSEEFTVDIRKHLAPLTITRPTFPFTPLIKQSRKMRRILKSVGATLTTPPDQNLVFGWASVAFTSDGKQVIDTQGHMIDIQDLEDAAYNGTLTRQTGEMHKSEPVGELVESMVFTPEKLSQLGLAPDALPQGWWTGWRVPPDVFTKVKSGEYTMFSIEGSASLEPIDEID